MTLTIKESSQLNSSTKPASGSSESNTGQNSRSNPVCLEVPVTIRSLPGEKGEASSGPANPVREEARTVIVFDNGAVLRLASNLPPGQSVIVSNPQGCDVVCRVASAQNLPTVKGYVEIEFAEPANDFWGIHQTAGQTNVSNPPATMVVAKPPIVPSDPLPDPPAPPRVAPTVPETIAPTGNAPSFEDVKGLVRMIPPPTGRVKAPESTPRIPAAKNADESAHGSVEAARPYSTVSTRAPTGELTSLSGTWESPSVPVRKPSPPRDFLGKSMFSSAQITSVSSSSESGGRTPLIIAGTAVLLVGLGTGWFFMHRGSVATSVVPVPVASQPSTPVRPAETSAPEPVVIAQDAVHQAPPSPPVVSTISSVSTDIVAAPAASASQATRRPVSNVDVKQPEQAAHRRQPIPDLKMSAPTTESRNAGRLVDGSVPNIADVAAANPMIATPAGAMLANVARTDNPPAPSPAVAGSGPLTKTIRDAKLISSTRPVYPPMAKQANVEGDVLLSAEVDATGKVIGAKAISGPVLLRQAAIDAVRQWKYEPALINGKSASTQVSVKIEFRLK
jgi:TonB family protein